MPKTTPVALTDDEIMALARLCRYRVRKAERHRAKSTYEPAEGRRHADDNVVRLYGDLLAKLVAAAPPGFDVNDGGREARAGVHREAQA